MFRKLFLILTILAMLVAAVGCAGATPESAATAEVGESESEIVTVFVGDLSASASASGRLQAQKTADLSFTTQGRVAEVLVAVGDEVTAGQVLVQLDTADLQRNLLNAQQALLIQESNLADLLIPPTAAAIALQEANVANAQARLDALLAGPSAADVATAEANVRQAQASLNGAGSRLAQTNSGGSEADLLAAEQALVTAQDAARLAEERHRSSFDCTYVAESDTWDCVGGSAREEAARVQLLQAQADLAQAQERVDSLRAGGNTSSIASNQASVASAQANLDAAQARLAKVLAGPSAAEIATAEANLATAQANLADLLAGPSEAERVRQEVAVAQAQLNVQTAERNLAKATLTAPFAGLVTAVNATPGGQANGTMIQLVAADSYEVVLDVDEVDIGQISPSQPVLVTLEAWPEVELTAEVASIAPQASQSSAGIVSYEVFLALEPTELPLLVGMTANAQLQTAERLNTLLVPNRAINADREAGTYSVTLVVGEQMVETAVTIGLQDENFTEITSGLQEGDQLLIGNDLPSFFGEQNGPGPGGGGPPGFGG